jgi:hypothetical protein
MHVRGHVYLRESRAFGRVTASRWERGQAARETIRICFTLRRLDVVSGRQRDEECKEREKNKKSDGESLHRVGIWTWKDSEQWVFSCQEKKRMISDDTPDVILN